MLVKLLARLVAVAAIVSIASHFTLPTVHWILIYNLRQQQNNKIFIKTSCSRFCGGFQAAIAAPSLSCFLSSDFKK
jgi:hypothetical protein